MPRHRTRYYAKQKQLLARAAVLSSLDPALAKSVRDLEQQLEGSLVTPDDEHYNLSRLVWNPAFQSFPRFIVYCETASDVRLCLSFARSHDLTVTVRAGGHSTAGYSVNDGFVIDVSRIRYVVVDEFRGKRCAVVGAGTTFRHLNSVLNEYGLHVPGGSCEDVCVAGYMQGGGYGVTSREFGMNCDNVLEVLVILSNETLVRANREQNADLFWAIRGGTGNNFGIVLQITYAVQPLGTLWGFQLQWPLENAADALTELQSEFMGEKWKRLGHTLTMSYADGQGEILLMSGLYDGSQGEARQILKNLLITGTLREHREGTYASINRWLFSGPYDLPSVPAAARELKDCCYIAEILDVDDWRQVIEYFQQSPNSYSCIVIEPYGGAINQYPLGLDGNAFIHRNVLMDFYADVFWVDESQQDRLVKWLDGLFSLVGEYSNGHRYQNYPRKGNKEYRSEYWGDYFDWLLFVKNKYDALNLFHFEQDISAVSESKQAPSGTAEVPLIFQQREIDTRL